MLTENRYRVQIPSYKNECEKLIKEHNTKFRDEKRLQIYLLIGGEETDLFPPHHSLCTSKVGSKSLRFYKDLVKYNIKFISASAIWVMFLRSVIKGRRLCWDLLFDKIFQENTLGLVSSGIVLYDKEKYGVEAIPKEVLKFSEIVFS